MTKNEITRMISLIDDTYLKEAITPPVKKRLSPSPIAAAACLAVMAIGGAFAVAHHHSVLPSPIAPSVSSADKTAVYIPKMQLPDSNNSAADMFGIIEYEGRIYVQAEYIDYADSPNLQNLTGEYLGTADGSLYYDCVNPDSPRAESDVDSGGKNGLASNLTGDVHAVKGYDTTFRICIPKMYEGCEFMAFFECLNGISYHSGSEIFDNRLHLPGNVASVVSLDSEDGARQALDLTPAEIEGLVNALCMAAACEMPDTLQERYVLFLMRDGTQNTLWLCGNNIVCYRGCYMKLSDSAGWREIEAKLD